MDVAVTSPLAPTYVRKEEPCEWYAATQKHGKYDASFEGTDYFFSAIIFETLGAINIEGEGVLKMFRFAATRLGREFTSYCGRCRATCNVWCRKQLLPLKTSVNLKTNMFLVVCCQ